MNDTHARWTDRLSDYLDGGLDAAERAALEEHLAMCGACASVLEDLRTIVAAAGRLGEIRPPRDLWPAISGGMLAAEPGAEGAGVIPLRVSDDRVPPGRRGLFLTVPQIAAAAVLLITLSAAGAWSARRSPSVGAEPAGLPATGSLSLVADVPAPPPRFATQLADLEAVLASARRRLDPNTVRILDRNLGVIERAIVDSYGALALDPGNEFLEGHLERVFERKLEFLREAATIVGWAG